MRHTAMRQRGEDAGVRLAHPIPQLLLSSGEQRWRWTVI